MADVARFVLEKSKQRFDHVWVVKMDDLMIISSHSTSTTPSVLTEVEMQRFRMELSPRTFDIGNVTYNQVHDIEEHGLHDFHSVRGRHLVMQGKGVRAVVYGTPNFFIVGAGPGENIEPVDLTAFVQASMLMEIPYFVLTEAGEVLTAVWLIER